nr:MAG TPA: hypothetical protein [Caudoviricetes sp.]DAX35799.1 MAG TPA: hypothetical protein [Caudoviricetes sp.]
MIPHLHSATLFEFEKIEIRNFHILSLFVEL